MKIDQTMFDNLTKISSKSGLPLRNLEKELQLFGFIPKLFHLLEENRIPAALYGGTALNKGFFKEKQRFSKDLDIDLPSRNFKNYCNKIDLLLQQLKEYRIEKTYLGEDAGVWNIWYGNKPWESLLIEARKQPIKDKAKKIELHSILEFLGIPILPIYVPSYSLEHLLARKIIALSRRAIGKDIYDSYLGLKMNPDRNKILATIKKITKKDPKLALNEAIYWLDEVNLKSSDVTELQDTVPVSYREDMRSMINSLKYELKRFL
ncbi:MAG: nucleotidyl transferase AbiEii/AbiGii toxin family protein [Candidatus Micrarchaeia archaeon]